jgi:hypothetical protein
MLAKSMFDVYQHCATEKKKHILMHKGVADAIEALYGGQDLLRSGVAKLHRDPRKKSDQIDHHPTVAPETGVRSVSDPRNEHGPCIQIC